MARLKGFDNVWLYRTTKKSKNKSDGCNLKYDPRRLGKLKYFKKKLTTNATSSELLLLKKLIPSLKESGLDCTPYFQHIIPHGKQNFIIDIYITKAKIAIEVDGKHHQEDPKQKFKDMKRDNILAYLGISVIRVSNKEVQEDVRTVVNRIICAIAGRLSVIS